jgi:hypothetical protein
VGANEAEEKRARDQLDAEDCGGSGVPIPAPFSTSTVGFIADMFLASKASKIDHII